MDSNIDKVREDKYWCTEGCGFVDKNHRCEQWGGTIRIPKEAISALSDIDPDAIRREVCDKLLGALESVPYSDKKREGASAYDDAIDVCLQTVNAKIASILSAEPAQDDGKEEAKE